MSRYATMFQRCGSRGEAAFGGFLMLGDPAPIRCGAYLDALVDGGADMVELGIPFSDPVADGPVIQAAAERALKAGVGTTDAISIVAGFRARHPDFPIGILTYANIVAARGRHAFCERLADAGVDSLLIADVPSIEAEPYAKAATAAGIAPVMIAATNTPKATLARIAALSEGYTYCVARAGVTGTGTAPGINHRALVDALADAGAPPPVFGFGISRPEHIRSAIDQGAAGVISGSVIVERIARDAPPDDIAAFVARLKAATRGTHASDARESAYIGVEG